MKKIVAIILTLAFSSSFFLSAQEVNRETEVFTSSTQKEALLESEKKDMLHNELYAGYGVVTANTFFTLFLSVFKGVFTAVSDSIYNDITDNDKETSLDFSDSGVVSIGYNYYINDVVYTGLLGTWQHFSIDAASDMTVASALLNFGVQYGWEKVKFYNELGAGLWLLSSENETQPYFCMNLTWFGIKFQPTEHLWLNIDSCIGQKGIINAGLRVRF